MYISISITHAHAHAHAHSTTEKYRLTQTAFCSSWEERRAIIFSSTVVREGEAHMKKRVEGFSFLSRGLVELAFSPDFFIGVFGAALEGGG